MKIIRRAIFILVCLFCFLIIIGFPVNKYEWMLSDDPELTLETLPIDDNASTYPWFAISPFLFLLLCIAFAGNRERHALILAGAVLLCIWAYRFRSILFSCGGE